MIHSIPTYVANTSVELPIDSLMLSAEQIEEIELSESLYEQARKNPSVPSAFVTGLAYTSAVGAGEEFAPEDLEAIPVGQKDFLAQPLSLTASEGDSPAENNTESPNSVDSKEGEAKKGKESKKVKEARKALKLALAELYGESLPETEAEEVAKNAKERMSFKKIAYNAQKDRVSRRILMAGRAKNLNIVCEKTGIVSQLLIPAIPGKAFYWDSPFSSPANCRGLAQQGKDYLYKLDTQVLAGILISLAGTYNLFRFQPHDSGAQKNAILRAAGKDYIILAIILIEERIHSNNAKHLPKLSLVLDDIQDTGTIGQKLASYIKILSEAIEEPDTSTYDENYVDKTYRIRPQYQKEVDKKVSFLAKQETADAKKAFAEDKKLGKEAISLLCKECDVPQKRINILLSMMEGQTLLTIPVATRRMVAERLQEYDSAHVATLRKIILKNRARISESLEDAFEVPTEQASKESEKVEESKEPSEATEGNEVSEPPFANLIEKLLWRKKIAAAKERTIVTSDIPSVAQYVPSAQKVSLTRDVKE